MPEKMEIQTRVFEDLQARLRAAESARDSLLDQRRSSDLRAACSNAVSHLASRMEGYYGLRGKPAPINLEGATEALAYAIEVGLGVRKHQMAPPPPPRPPSL